MKFHAELMILTQKREKHNAQVKSQIRKNDNGVRFTVLKQGNLSLNCSKVSRNTCMNINFRESMAMGSMSLLASATGENMTHIRSVVVS